MNNKSVVTVLLVMGALLIAKPAFPVSMMGLGVGVFAQASADDSPSIATLMVFVFDLVHGPALSLGLACEAAAASRSCGEGDLTTAPVLVCARATLSPGGALRLYGTAGAGICIAKYSGWQTDVFLFVPVVSPVETIIAAFALTAGGGVELGVGAFALCVDYRYLQVPEAAGLGGHLLTAGFVFRL